MSTTTGPFTAVLNTLISCPDPTANGGNSAVAVQVQNSSEFVLQVLAGGEQYTIQSFTATTIPLNSSGGAGALITPIADSASGLANQFFLVWLLGENNQQGYESPPIEDGPLTAAAIASLLAAITSQTPQVSIFNKLINTVPQTFSFPIPAAVNALIFSLGIVSPNPEGIRLNITGADGSQVWDAWPISSLGVTPGTSNRGQGFIVPVMPNVQSPISVLFEGNLGGGSVNVACNGMTGPVPASSPPEAVASITPFNNPPNGGTLLATDSVGRLYEVWSLAIANDGTSNILNASFSNGTSIFAGVAVNQTVAYNLPIVLSELIIADAVYSGVPAGVATVSVAWRYHN